jgi:phage baseplate assembly protein W
MSNTNANTLGQSWGCVSDLSMPSYMATGFQCVGEAIARRWSTSQGQLLDDPNYGLNLTDLIGQGLTPAQIQYYQQQAGAEAQKDERVLSCIVQLTLNAAGTLDVEALVQTAAGPFQLVGSVSAIGTTILSIVAQ